MELLKTIGCILAAIVFCCWLICAAIGLVLNATWHLVVLGPWGSLALVTGCACAFLLCRRKTRTSPK